MHNGGVSMLVRNQELASEQNRSAIELAEQLRQSRRLRMLRRATRIERKAERRLLEAWQRAEELRGTLDPADY
jgi:pantothenate synthetase